MRGFINLTQNAHLQDRVSGGSAWVWPVSAEFHQAHKKFECVPILDFDLNGEQQLPSIKSIYPNDGRSARNMMMPLIFPTSRACSPLEGKVVPFGWCVSEMKWLHRSCNISSLHILFNVGLELLFIPCQWMTDWGYTVKVGSSQRGANGRGNERKVVWRKGEGGRIDFSPLSLFLSVLSHHHHRHQGPLIKDVSDNNILGIFDPLPLPPLSAPK